jgi:2-oxoisovalerate dehydrogenase E1 component
MSTAAKRKPAAAAKSAPSKSAKPKPNDALQDLDTAKLVELYREMQLLRKFELAAQVACRSGETPGFLHLYIGEEAVAVGACAHLRRSDWITSTHRGHGHALAKGMDPNVLMAELYGKGDGCCGGRGGTMHLYDPSVGLFGTNGIVGGGIPSAVGAAISAKHRKTGDVAVTFFGDGATNHAAFHESLNFAGMMRAPVIFICENNLYATATALKNVTLNPEIATRAAAYGIPGVAVDGNDVIAMWRAMKTAADRARRGEGPTLIEAKTYRTSGTTRATRSPASTAPRPRSTSGPKRCPIQRLRGQIVDELELVDDKTLDAIDAEIDKVVAGAIDFARKSPEPDPHAYARHVFADQINPAEAMLPGAEKSGGPETSWLDAVRDGIAEEMRRNRDIIYFGEGTGERGGTFAHTKGLYQEFGADRLVDTPISELGFTGASLGASATGVRCIADLMFADFLFEAGGQIALQAAKLRYMSNGRMQAPMVVRVGAGAVRSAGPHHSGTYHPVWAHIPGLIVCMPSTPADAKGLMKTALRASDPVLMLETKALFASKGPVPQGEHFVPFGVARIARQGRDLTIVRPASSCIARSRPPTALARDGIECEVIDLRTIQPLDVDTVAASVRKTHRLLVVDEGWAPYGVGAEIGQSIQEACFDHLDGPVVRLHTDFTSHPFAPSLEKSMLVNTDRIVATARRVLQGEAVPIRRPRATGIDASLPAMAAPVAAAPAASAASAAPAAAEIAVDGTPIKMPFGDLTVSEGKLVRWLKKTGEQVRAKETVVEIETDKAVVEIEAPVDGVLGPTLRQAGDVVKMGETIGSVK